MRNPRNDTLGSPKSEAGTAPGNGSERRCVLTGESSGRDDLVRLALSPANEDGIHDVLPDALAKAPGRGAWIGVAQHELADAVTSGRLKGALSRAFKTGAVNIPEDLPARVRAALEKAFLQRLGLEMRSGMIILGSDRIRDEARMGGVAALYHAADASEDGCKKLDQALRVGLDVEGSGLQGARLPLDRKVLSVALGRDNVVHLALADAKSAERVAIPLGRLQTFLGAVHAAGTSEDVSGGAAADASA